MTPTVPEIRAALRFDAHMLHFFRVKYFTDLEQARRAAAAILAAIAAGGEG